MTNDTISITIHSPELLSAIRQLAEAITGRTALLPEPPVQTRGAPEATAPTILHLRKMYDLKKIFTLYTGKTKKAA